MNMWPPKQDQKYIFKWIIAFICHACGFDLNILIKKQKHDWIYGIISKLKKEATINYDAIIRALFWYVYLYT